MNITGRHLLIGFGWVFLVVVINDLRKFIVAYPTIDYPSFGLGLVVGGIMLMILTIFEVVDNYGNVKLYGPRTS